MGNSFDRTCLGTGTGARLARNGIRSVHGSHDLTPASHASVPGNPGPGDLAFDRPGIDKVPKRSCPDPQHALPAIAHLGVLDAVVLM